MNEFLINLVNSDEFDGMVRHGLSLFGGFMVANGYASSAGPETILGWSIAMVAVVWSVANKTYMRGQVKNA
jgi:hypothetical protein